LPPGTRPRLVIVGLLLGTFLAALELNVVGTAMPTLVAQLGGIELYGLVFSAYLLTSTVSVPLYGRLADLQGRKPVYLVAIALFLLGSALSGAAPSMVPLIIFRAIQGLGAGGLIPITITLFGDLFPAERRALVQGLFSTVWGVSSVLGPLAGGFLVTYVSWRWVFWLNIPAGLLAALLVLVSLHEHRPTDGPRGIDLPGTALLVSALVSLLLGLQGVEGARGWSYPLLGAAALLALLFFRQEQRSERPIVPLSLFRNRAMLVTNVGGLALGGLLFSIVTFIPLFVQGVLHGTPTHAGLALVPLSLVWTAATFASGPLSARLGYRPVVILGGVLAAIGAGALLLIPAEAGQQTVRHLAMVTIGAAMGLIITATTIAVQDAVPWQRRGVATALIQFSRTVGGMVAVTLLGALVTARFARIGGLPPGTTPDELLDPHRWESIDPATLGLARETLAAALRQAFWALAALGALVLIINLAFPPLKVDNRPSDAT